MFSQHQNWISFAAQSPVATCPSFTNSALFGACLGLVICVRGSCYQVLPEYNRQVQGHLWPLTIYKSPSPWASVVCVTLQCRYSGCFKNTEFGISIASSRGWTALSMSGTSLLGLHISVHLLWKNLRRAYKDEFVSLITFIFRKLFKTLQCWCQ